jgi:chemotaxis regulatin CheY-phosphate phosphatase CheZ
MKKILITLISLSFIGGNVFAQSMIIQSSTRANISIPSGVEEYASEKDIIESLCYEAKWKGGEGVARIEALNEIVSPALNEISGLGIETENIDLESDARETREKLEAICNASTIKEATEKVNEYVSFSEKLKDSLQNKLKTSLKGVESELKEQGEKLKNRIENELNVEAEQKAKEAEERIRREAEKEAGSLEAQLRGLAGEFQSFMSQGEVNFGEARSKARELAGRISADPQTSSFLSSKLEDILGEAANIASGQTDPSAARALVEERVPRRVEEIKTFMKQKYEKMAEEEEAKIRNELQKKADELGGQERERMEKIRDVFTDFDQRLENSSKEKMSEWSQYEEKSIEKKREIIVKAVESYFTKAINVVEARKDDINLALEIGVAEEYGITPYDELIKLIEKDKEEIINQFLGSDFSPSSINTIKNQFQNKWGSYQEKMEKIEVIGDGTLESVLKPYWDERVDWKRIQYSMNLQTSNLELLERQLKATYADYDQCSDEFSPENVQRRITEEKINVRTETARTMRGVCRNCEILKEIQDLGKTWLEKVSLDEFRQRIKKFENDADRFQEILREYSNNRTLPINQAPIPLTEFFKAKDQLLEAQSYFKEIEDISNQVVGKYRPSYNRASNTCWGK